MDVIGLYLMVGVIFLSSQLCHCYTIEHSAGRESREARRNRITGIAKQAVQTARESLASERQAIQQNDEGQYQINQF